MKGDHPDSNENLPLRNMIMLPQTLRHLGPLTCANLMVSLNFLPAHFACADLLAKVQCYFSMQAS